MGKESPLNALFVGLMTPAGLKTAGVSKFGIEFADAGFSQRFFIL